MSKRSFGSYIAELIIVIIGVTVAFWISTIADKKKEKEAKNNYYIELIEEINGDIRELEYALNHNKKKQEKLGGSLRFYENPSLYKDSIVSTAFLVGSYSFFEAEDITYQSIIASGDLKMIKSKEVKKELIRLYGTYEHIEKLQEGFLDALDQNFFPLLVKNVDYSTGQVMNPEFVKDLQIKNYIMYTYNELNQHNKWYAVAIKRGNKVVGLLETAINESK